MRSAAEGYFENDEDCLGGDLAKGVEDGGECGEAVGRRNSGSGRKQWVTYCRSWVSSEMSVD